MKKFLFLKTIKTRMFESRQDENEIETTNKDYKTFKKTMYK